MHTTNKGPRPSVSQIVNELDVFPKLPRECKKSTWSGGLGNYIRLKISSLQLLF